MKGLRRWVLAGGALLLAGACAAEPTWPCRVGGLAHEVRCGRIQRALDPARPEGVRIDIHYVLVPALARRKLPDPVFLLAGGPGQSAISLAPSALALLSRLNNRRDIVFVDQRGTGRSAPLDCGDTRHEPLDVQADTERQFTRLIECRDRLQRLPHGDLRFFTTTLAMQDLDAVRREIGAGRINLVGGSYGTRAALEYQRQFPQAVRRSVIDGVAPPDMVLPASIAIDTQAAFEAMLRACEQEAACAGAHPRLRADWIALLAGLPRTVTVPHPLTGRPERLTITRDLLTGAMRGPLYAPMTASALPQVISDAARGEFAGLVGINDLFSGRKRMSLAMGMHFSVVCAEDFPRLGLSTASGGDFGGAFSEHYGKVCQAWPRGSVPPAFYGLPPSATPVLVLSGGLDPATPPRHGERVARALGAKAVHVVVPQAGHGVMGVGCMRDVVHRFIDAPDDAQALAVDAGCAKDVPRPPAFQPIARPGAP